MDFKDFYDASELLKHDKIDDFRHIELFTRDLVDKQYHPLDLIKSIEGNRHAMQKLGFLCEIALEYASASEKENGNLNILYNILDVWRGQQGIEEGVMLNEYPSLADFVKDKSGPKAKKWGIISDYSSNDFAKFHVLGHDICH